MRAGILVTAFVAAVAHPLLAEAAPTDVVFMGGLTVTSTSGCTGWNPDKRYFTGTYWVPVAGSTNGPDSVLTMLFPGGGGEGFEIRNGEFTSTYKTATAYHIFTRVGTYSAQVKITSRNPATVTTTTPAVGIKGSIKGFDNLATCVVNFSANMLKQLDP